MSSYHSNTIPSYEDYKQYISLLQSLDQGVEVASWSTSAPHSTEPEETPKSRKRGITEPKLKTNWTEKEIWKKYATNYENNKLVLEPYYNSMDKTVNGVNPITFTLSPQSTPGFRTLSTVEQYNRFKLFFATIRELYNIEYVAVFELYPQSPQDIHCHGFIKTASAKKLKEIRAEWKRWHRNCKPTDTRFRDHSQKFEIAHDLESVERWKLYCLKDQAQMITLGYPPIRCVQS